MSADNAVVVLKSPRASGPGFEYRVREVHALGNLYAKGDHRRLDKVVIASAFGDCPVLNHQGAQKASSSLKRTLHLTGQIVEYGVIQLAVTQPFPVRQ